MTVTSLKVKVLRRPSLKLKVLPRFPSSVSAASPILLDPTGGNFAFSLDTTALHTSLVGTFAFSDILGSVAPSQLPNPTATTLGGVKSLASANHKWLKSIGTDGLPTQTQPDLSDITGLPTTTVAGNLAFFSNTTGSALGANPAFQAANPGNASLYSQLANPANGYTTIFNGVQFSQGTAIPVSKQFGANGSGLQQSIVGTLSIAAGDTAVQGQAIAGYVETASAAVSAVGVFGQAQTTIANASVFGSNFIAQNLGQVVSHTGLNLNFIAAVEADVNLWKTSGVVDPTVTNDNAFCYVASGGGDLSGPIGTAYGVITAGTVNNAKWNHGFRTLAGSAVSAITAGPLNTGNSQSSQPLSLQGTDAGGITRIATIQADPNGAIGLFPAGVGATFTSKLQLTGMSVAGVVINDASGFLSTSTSLGLPGSILSSSASGGVGYSTGSGGTVTQLTNKSTAVTLNKTSGAITMNNAALAANAVVSFVLTNSAIAASDAVLAVIQSGTATVGTYNVWAEKAASGSVNICLRNISAGSLSEAVVIQFAIIKSVTA